MTESDPSPRTALGYSGRKDGFTIRQARFPVIAVITISTIWSFSAWIGLLSSLVGIAALAIWFLSMIVRAVIASKNRLWRRAISLALIAVLIGPVIAAEMLLGDYVHFALCYPHYRAVIAASVDSQSKPISFDWGLAFPAFVGQPSDWRSLVYDATDEMAKHLGRKDNAEFPGTSRYVRHFVGHFYLSTLSIGYYP